MLSSSNHSTDNWTPEDYYNTPGAHAICGTAAYADMIGIFAQSGEEFKVPNTIQIVFLDPANLTFQMWDIGGHL